MQIPGFTWHSIKWVPGTLSPGMGPETVHLLSFSVEVKNPWRYTSTLDGTDAQLSTGQIAPSHFYLP
jgi:hypothetical protein